MIHWYNAHLVLIQATFTGLLLALSVQAPLRMGVFSFAGIGSFGIGAYGAGILALHYRSLPPLALILAAAVVSGAVGSVLALLLARLSGLYLGMATIAFDLIIGVVVINGGKLTGGPTGLYGVLVDLSMLEIVVVTAAAVAFLAWTERGRVGRRIDVVREDPELAAAMGVSVQWYRRAAFVVSGILGGSAGAIAILIRTAIGPADISFTLVVLALTMIIVGGATSWVGAVIGAVIFTWLPIALSFVGRWQPIIYGLIVALAAIYVPGGIYGVITDAYRKRQQRALVQRMAVPMTQADPALDDDRALLDELTGPLGTNT